jgi:hypothetical protein
MNCVGLQSQIVTVNTTTKDGKNDGKGRDGDMSIDEWHRYEERYVPLVLRGATSSWPAHARWQPMVCIAELRCLPINHLNELMLQ